MITLHALLRPFFIAGVSLLISPGLVAGTADLSISKTSAGIPQPVSPEANWLTGEGVALAGVLFPQVHFDSIYGGSTADPATLAVGHHDPDRKGWTISNIEFGASLRVNEYIEAFGTYAAKIDPDDKWAGEYEEWFLKLKNLPGGLEIRGGQYYNRIGIQNTFHPHGFDWADQYLVNGRFLGEDGLASIGGEVTWKLPVNWTSLINISVGVAPTREEEAHAEPEVEPEFEAEGATFDDVITVVNWTNLFDYNDFHQFRAGLSGAWGDNLWGKTSQIYGAHFEYQWRQNGYESGGRYFRWRTEAMLRSFEAVSGHLPGEVELAEEGDEAHDEKPHTGSFDEVGLYSSVAYGLNNGLEFGLRGEFVEGIAAAGLDRRFRVSPGATYYLNKARTVKLRLQYNYDHSNDFDDEHSIWAQVGFAWGGAEVR
ncbi:hypothetical protein BH11VER1_BH11VER1_30450 [soil metagenome]